MRFKYLGKIPLIDLNFTCEWDREINADTKSFIPTFKYPLIIRFEGCSPSIKLWKKDKCWHVRVFKS